MSLHLVAFGGGNTGGGWVTFQSEQSSRVCVSSVPLWATSTTLEAGPSCRLGGGGGNPGAEEN